MTRNLVSLSLSLLFSLQFAPEAVAKRRVTGMRLPRTSLRTIAARPALPPVPRLKGHEEERVVADVEIEKRTGVVRWFAASEAVPAPPPAVTRGFPSTTSTAILPGDASGAVGRNHVVTSTNAGVTVHDRDGHQLLHVTQNQFWADDDSGHYYFDPRIAYDAARDRWVAVTVLALSLDRVAHMAIGVSATADPAGAWLRYRITIPFLDFLRLALTRDAVVVVTRVDGGDSATLVSIDKSHLYAGPPELAATLVEKLPVDAFPVHAPDASDVYLLSTSADGILVNRLDRIEQAWVQYWTSEKSVDELAPKAPQKDTARELDTGYDDVYAATLRNGVIYATRVVVRETDQRKRAAILWAAIRPETGKGLRYGLIDDPAGQLFYAYPSLAVNQDGAMLVSFASFSEAQYASAGYVYIDPAGRASSPGLLKSGEAPVTETERWGDYSTTNVDPRNGRDFWTVQIYATSQNTWGTWWGASLRRWDGAGRSGSEAAVHRLKPQWHELHSSREPPSP